MDISLAGASAPIETKPFDPKVSTLGDWVLGIEGQHESRQWVFEIDS